MTKHELINTLMSYLSEKQKESHNNHLEMVEFMSADLNAHTTDDLVERMKKNAYYEGQIRMGLDIISILKQA